MSGVKRWDHAVRWEGMKIAASYMAIKSGGKYVLASDYERDTQALKIENEKLEDGLGKTELRALKFIHQCNAHVDLYRELRAERDELRAQVEVMRADAERYRWMRSSFVRNHKHSLIWYLPTMTQLTAEGLDENVDAALQAEPRGTAE